MEPGRQKLARAGESRRRNNPQHEARGRLRRRRIRSACLPTGRQWPCGAGKPVKTFAFAAFATCLVAGCTTVSTSASKPAIAITVDDLPVHGAIPRGATPSGVAREVIAALTAQDVNAYGFGNG